MKHAYATGSTSHASRRGRILAASLTVVLLLCHGAFGALHQVSSWPVEHPGGYHASATVPAAAPTTDHQMGHQAPVVPPALLDHQTGEHVGAVAHAGYAAALFVVLLGTAALALFFAWSPARSSAADARLPGRALALFHLCSPCVPTLPLLQVFRL